MVWFTLPPLLPTRRERGFIAPHLFNPSIRFEWSDSRSRRFYLQGETAGTIRTDPKTGVDAFDKENIFAPAGYRARFLGCAVRRIAGVPPELHRLTLGVTEMLANVRRSKQFIAANNSFQHLYFSFMTQLHFHIRDCVVIIASFLTS